MNSLQKYNMHYFSNVSCSGSRWVIERRVAGTKQVSTVGHLLPDPSPLSFLDSSSALSPWTTYQYRLVLHNQAGNTTGKVLITSLSKSKFSLPKKGLVLQLLNCTKNVCCYRALGQYYHQTFSTRWPQSTKD